MTGPPRSTGDRLDGDGRPPGGDPALAPSGARPTAQTPSSGRPMALRLARVHLRVGSLLLARAELEALAGRGTLDAEALVDLAEARWRTGDLAGAGEAASALVDRGREDAVALAIAAEAVAAEGRPGEARRLAGRALAALPGPTDALFAGMPRSTVWPIEPVPEPADLPAAAVAGAAVPARPGRHRPGSPPVVEPADGTPASASAAEALAGGLAALGGGDAGMAALRLGVALRLEPDYAEAVLEAIGSRSADPALALVAGDAYRLLGREAEALDAFDRARGHG